MRNLTTITIAAAAILAVTSPAHAEPASATYFAVDVTHDDLDLATREGVARLDERLRNHVRRLCANGGRDRASIKLEQACQTSALACVQDDVRLAIAEAQANKVRLAQTSNAEDALTPGV